ncbi:MAG: DciA family protein [Burkholderiales bacterium]
MGPLRSIGHMLDSLTATGSAMERVRTLIALQNLYGRFVAPELAARSRVSHEQGSTLFIQADTAAVAAKLRNLAPRILQELRMRWPNLTGIQIGMQPTPPRPAAIRTPAALSESSRTELQHLSATLPEGDLRRAVARLSRR